MSIETVRKALEESCPSLGFLLRPDKNWRIVALYNNDYAEIKWLGNGASIEYNGHEYQCNSCSEIVKKTILLLTGNEPGLTRYLD